MTTATRWILAIVGLLLANMIAMGVLVTFAHGGAQVIPDYYERGLAHDHVQAEAAHSRQLDWRVDVQMTRDTIVVEVHDASGAPVVGRVGVTGYPRAHATRTLEAALGPIGPGRYQARHSNERGWHDLVIAIDTPAARDTQQLAAEAP